MRAVTTSERIRVNDAAAGTRGVRFRRFVWLVALVPPLLYSPAILREYGLRDDYSMLREAIVQPAKLIAVCVAEGLAGLEGAFDAGATDEADGR